MLRKVTRDNQDMNLAILTWHNTPTEGGNYSPVQKLQSRRTHKQLPTASELLHPEIRNGIDEEIQKKDRRPNNNTTKQQKNSRH